VFLHHIVPGGADRSYGIHVAQLAGLPKPVIRRAEELLEELEQGQRDHATSAAPEEAPLQLSLFGGKIRCWKSWRSWRRSGKSFCNRLMKTKFQRS
jgi:DNA mismatch repair protein MutS